MWAFIKAWAQLRMGFYAYMVYILLNYVHTQHQMICVMQFLEFVENSSGLNMILINFV